MTREDLFKVPVPERTESYSPVAHKAVIRRVETQLQKNNLEIYSEDFKVARDGKQVIGLMNIRYNGEKELGMQFAWQNSYDKSKPVAFSAGAHAWICMNGMIVGEIQYVRRHTGTVLEEIAGKIAVTVEQLTKRFANTQILTEKMKNISVSKRTMSELAGRLYIEHEIITATQLSVIKKEIIQPTFEPFKYENLWSFYNHVTFALKEEHPSTYLQTHKKFHGFVETEYGLI